MSTIEKMIDKLKRSPDKRSLPEALPSKSLSDVDAGAAERRPKSEKTRRYHVNISQLKNLGFIAPKADQARIAEEYRRIKRPLLANAFGKGSSPIEMGNVIMIASAMSGEGKTFNTINLALSMANEMDNTVLVVDLDVLNPALTRLFDLDEELGLTDVLSDPNVTLEDVILTTDLPKLKVLPAGRLHVQANELLASEQMRRVAHELSTRYPDRIVIFDAPPLLMTSEANVVAGLVGQILLVVEAGKTPQNAVKETVALLDDRKVIGVVLNKHRGSTKGQYGAYYGAYGEEQG